MKHIDIKEFCEKGYLQEVNRQFFHPLGLALEVTVEDDGTEYISGVHDMRDDPAGYAFADEFLGNFEVRWKAEQVAYEFAKRRQKRCELFGNYIQPIEI